MYNVHTFNVHVLCILVAYAGNAVYVRREVVSYDMDLMDGTVLACVLAAYCPFLVGVVSLVRMYTVDPLNTYIGQVSHNTVGVLLNQIRMYMCMYNNMDIRDSADSTCDIDERKPNQALSSVTVGVLRK